MFNLVILCKLRSDIFVNIQNIYNFDGIHHLAFWDKPLSDASTSDNTNTDVLLELFPKHRRRDAFGTWQIYNLTVFI